VGRERNAIVCRAAAPFTLAIACGCGAATGTASPGAASAAGERLVRLPGSRVQLTLPASFCRPTRQVTLVNRDGVALVIIEGNLPAGVTTAEWLSGLGEEMDKWASGPITARQEKRGNVTVRLTRMSLGKQNTMVADMAGERGAFATVIATYDPRVEKVAEAVVSSASIDPGAPLDPFAMLGLHVPDTAGLELVAGPVAPIVLQEAPASSAPSAATYSVSVLPPPSAAPSAESLRDVLAEQLATASIDLKPDAVTFSTIDGMPAAEAIVDEPGDEGGSVYAAALMDRGAIVLVKARADRARSASIDRFQRMTRGLRRVPDALTKLACP
jgi:hypothetical protein